MPVIVILLVVALVTFLQRVIYRRYWKSSLTAKVSFSDHYLYEGAQTTITEEMSNAKILPLPWVHLKFQIFRNGKTDNLFRSDVFNILFYQRIRRKSTITFQQRGVYQIPSLDLLSYDMLITRKFVHQIPNRASVTVYPSPAKTEQAQILYQKLVGEMATRRYTLEDPYLFKGLREYRPGDPLKSINFQASAKASSSGEKWLVNMHEFTLDQSVRVLLLCDKGTNFYDETEYEQALRLAAGMTAQLERSGIPVSFSTNGKDSLEHTMPSLKAGCSENHIDSVLEILARLDMEETGASGMEILKDTAQQLSQDEYLVIITPDHAADLVGIYEELSELSYACAYISPIRSSSLTSLSPEEKQLPERLYHFSYYPV